MKINILEKLVLDGKSAWAKVLGVLPIIVLAIIYLGFGLASDSDPKLAEKGLEWGFGSLAILPVSYFFIFFKWFKI